MSKMMRISDQTAQNLAQLSKVIGKSKQIILQKAVEAYVREQFLKKTNEEYSKLKKDKKEWKKLQEELEEWDVTLSDGLENE